MWWIAVPGKAHGDSIGPREFEEKFLSICKQHREDNIALAFAFILYRREDPFIRMLIENKFYWDALDEISGSFVSVFVFASPTRKPQTPQDDWSDQDLEEASDSGRLLSEHFSIGHDLKMPCILFFQVTNETVADSYLVPLINSDSIEGAYRELEEIMEAARSSVKDVKNGNKGNAQEIFNLLRSELKERAFWQGAKRGGTVIVTAAKLFGVLLKLVPGGLWHL